jgi:hypothetical protein
MNRLILTPYGEAVYEYMERNNIFWRQDAERQMRREQERLDRLPVSEQLKILASPLPDSKI